MYCPLLGNIPKNVSKSGKCLVHMCFLWALHGGLEFCVLDGKEQNGASWSGCRSKDKGDKELTSCGELIKLRGSGFPQAGN